jgi:hypothetical protein
MESVTASQKKICLKYKSAFVPPDSASKIGIALNTLSNKPFNALRQPPESDTCGWYIWGGEEFSNSTDFFQPLHIEHLSDLCPAIIPYLALAPGWRILLADNYEDVWRDDSLLKV